MGLMFAFIGIMLISGSFLVRGEYADNIDIDLVREDAYEQIGEIENASIYYCNSETENYLFIVFTNDITGDNISVEGQPVVDNTDIDYSRNAYTVEMALNRETFGNYFDIKIGDTIFMISLKAPASKPDDGDGGGGGTKDRVEIDFIGFLFSGEFTIVHIFLFTFFGIIIGARLAIVIKTPYMSFKTYEEELKEGNAQTKYAGRLANAEPAPKLEDYWRYQFSRFKKMRYIYSKLNKGELEQYSDYSLGFLKFYFYIILRKTKLPKKVEMYEMEMKKTARNYLLWFIYGLTILIPSVRLKSALYEAIERVPKRDENGNKIKKRYIYEAKHVFIYERLRLTCEISYQKKIIDEKRGVYWKRIPEKGTKRVSYHFYLDLKDDTEGREPRIKELEIKEKSYEVDKVKVTSPEEGIKMQQHIDNIRSVKNLTLADLQDRYITLSKKYEKVVNSKQNLKTKYKEELTEELRDLVNEIDKANLTLPQIAKIILRGKAAGKDIPQTLKDLAGEAEVEKNQEIKALKQENLELRKDLRDVIKTRGGNGGTDITKLKVLRDDDKE